VAADWGWSTEDFQHTGAVDAAPLVFRHLFLLMLRPKWQHGKKTDGSGDLFPVIHLNFNAAVDPPAPPKFGPKANQ
jgi:hypothetical protein